MHPIPRIVITPGEPAGIGPDIAIQIAQLKWNAELIFVCDPHLLEIRAKKRHPSLTIETADLSKPAHHHQPNHIKCIPIFLTEPAIPGKLNTRNVPYVLETLKTAAQLCLTQQASGLVTGPVNKSVINDAGVAFSGHTEFLAQESHVTQCVMLFVVDKLRVALATTHVPIKQVSSVLTVDHLSNTIRILDRDLKSKFNLSHPAILVCGLNPHAGEQGHLGREEIDIIDPALKQLQNEGINVLGPFSADSIFTEKYLKKADVILAMYHDQALPLIKYLSFGRAVNVTLGLPFIRTSVDHGTALDIAGTDQIDSGSMIAAIELAIELCG